LFVEIEPDTRRQRKRWLPQWDDTDHSIALFVLDTYAKDGRGQFVWLDKELKALRAQRGLDNATSNSWAVVLNHAPMSSGSMHGKSAVGLGTRRFLKPILDRHQVEAYFNGDDHTLQILRSAKTDYFVSGGGGGEAGYPTTALPETVFFTPDPQFGIMLHCMNTTTMQTSVYNDEGKLLHVQTTRRNREKV
jgi:hypothetical protein